MLDQIGQKFCQGHKAHGMAETQGLESEMLCQGGLTDTTGAPEQDILPGDEEVELE